MSHILRRFSVYWLSRLFLLLGEAEYYGKGRTCEEAVPS
jgi:hypothetical protein